MRTTTDIAREIGTLQREVGAINERLKYPIDNSEKTQEEREKLKVRQHAIQCKYQALMWVLGEVTSL